jgi:signal transduction histidine kinase/ActR/RegA family two-component response regulator
MTSTKTAKESSDLQAVRRLPYLAAAFSLISGLLTLVGWQWNLPGLKSIVPGFVAMNPVTAVTFLLAGLALLALQDRTRRPVALALAALVGVVGAARLLDLGAGTHLGVDRLLFRSQLDGGPGDTPNRIAPNTAITFVLTAAALLLHAQRPRRVEASQAVALVAGGIAFLSVVGYALAVHQLYGIGPFIPMALNTALTFGALALGILFTEPDGGVMRVFVANDAGGQLARRLVPLAVLGPALLAWIRFHVQRAGWFDVEALVSVMVLASSGLLAAGIWISATRLSRSDAARLRAVAELQDAHDELEDHVRSRTQELESANVRLHSEIGEHQRTTAALLQSQKMEAIGRLAGGIAHDFNNLLTAILGYTQLMLMRIPRDHELRGELTQVERAAERAAGLTRQLLAFSRQQVLQPVVLDVNRVIGDVDRMLRRLIGADVDLRTVPAVDLGRVRADPGQLEQVLMNLAVNARDAMPEGGKLTIETANVVLDLDAVDGRPDLAPGAYVLLAVTDNGVGMSPEVRARIFEPFFTTKSVGVGTGLGLSTVHGIVKQSGGSLEVYSEPGRGSTFKIYLPRVDAPLDAAGTPGPALTARRGTETVLVLEDEEIVRRVVTTTLARQGYRVLEAANRDEALATCAAQRAAGTPVDLLISDLVMPGMNLQEFSTRLPAVQPGLRTLYMSGYTDRAMLHQGLLDGTSPFLQKPFSVEALLLTVEAVLGHARNPTP